MDPVHPYKNYVCLASSLQGIYLLRDVCKIHLRLLLSFFGQTNQDCFVVVETALSCCFLDHWSLNKPVSNKFPKSFLHPSWSVSCFQTLLLERYLKFVPEIFANKIISLPLYIIIGELLRDLFLKVDPILLSGATIATNLFFSWNRVPNWWIC